MLLYNHSYKLPPPFTVPHRPNSPLLLLVLFFFFQDFLLPSLSSKMAAKRLREDPDDISDKPEGKRSRFTMIIRQAVAANYIQNFYLALEPVVRRVVQEEVERGLVRRACLLQRSPQMLMQEAKPSSGLQLIFKKPPSLPIFTENRIEDDDGRPLEILLTDTATVNRPLAAFPSSIKVEIVVLDGDFPYENSDNYSSSDFNRHIVKERRGRRPLLTGDTVVTLKDGSASIDELKFTDNSSWIRSRNFRLGLRVLPENQEGLNIREAVTGPFMVKDHRGETYKKHYPPLLGDEVWRLEKIGKDGVFHKRLMAANINTVQDFLKLSVIDSARLRKILGMSNSYRVAAVSHARTCPLGGKLYVYHGPHYTIVLNPICEIVNIEVDGVSWTFQELSLPLRATVQNVVSEAYNSWDSFEEISLPLATGEPVNQVVLEPHPIEGYFEVGLIQNEEQMGVYNSTQVMPNILFEEYEYNGEEN